MVESIARPLRRLQEEAAWFARAQEVKLLHIRTDATLRGAVLDMVMAHEHHADNRALYFRFDDAATGPTRGWSERAARMRERWPAKARSIAPAGIALRPLGDVALGVGGGDFGATLLKATQSLAAPLTQLVAVVAPVQVPAEQAASFQSELSALLMAPELKPVRWVVVEVDGASVAPLAARLGQAALDCVCLVDEQEQQDDLVAQGAATPDTRIVLADLPLPGWRAPGAMPDVQPPARVGPSRRASDEELTAAGLSPAFVNGGGQALKRLVLGGALSLRQGRHADAVTLQARAAELCAQMRMPREQVLNLHVLGGYLLAGQLRARAREVYRRAGEIARTGGFADLEAQGELALGMLEALEGRPAEAAAHYSTAGRLAQAAEIDVLAIECWRMAGQLALDARLEASAVECWKRALALAEPMEADAAQATSAAEIGRALAAIFRKRGQPAQAHSLEQRSLELEQVTAAAAPAKAAVS